MADAPFLDGKQEFIHMGGLYINKGAMRAWVENNKGNRGRLRDIWQGWRGLAGKREKRRGRN